ncbi:hypothetical protein JCM10450v2_007286 [Rhodotorula kratochvilovae]
MTQPQLPGELLSQIFGDVATSSDSTPSLLALSLSSRTFRTLAQPLLYRNLEITHLSGLVGLSAYALERRSAALRETLGKRPQLARKSRSLTLRFRNHVEGERINAAWRPTCEGFATLFELLCQVEVFKVSHKGTGRDPPAELDRALACMDRWRSTLHVVELYMLNNDTLRFVMSKPHLDFLTVYEVAPDCVPSPAQVAPLHLTTLTWLNDSVESFIAITSASHASLTDLSTLASLPFWELPPSFSSLTSLLIDFAPYTSHDPHIMQGYLNTLTLFLADDDRLLELILMLFGATPDDGLREVVTGVLPRSLERVVLAPWFMTAPAALDMLANARTGHEHEWRWPRSLCEVVWTRSIGEEHGLSQQECAAIQVKCASIGLVECRFEDETAK